MALIFGKTGLTAGQAALLNFVTNKEVNEAETSNANKTLAMVADGFGIENMFYKTPRKDGEGYHYTAHSSKTAELERMLKGE